MKGISLRHQSAVVLEHCRACMHRSGCGCSAGSLLAALFLQCGGGGPATACDVMLRPVCVTVAATSAAGAAAGDGLIRAEPPKSGRAARRACVAKMADANEKLLAELLKKPGNNVCADCGARSEYSPSVGPHFAYTTVCLLRRSRASSLVNLGSKAAMLQRPESRAYFARGVVVVVVVDNCAAVGGVCRVGIWLFCLEALSEGFSSMVQVCRIFIVKVSWGFPDG